MEQSRRGLWTRRLPPPRLRHISLSLVAEVSHPKIVQERAGHASATSTLRYVHSDLRQHREAVERVDALITDLNRRHVTQQE